MARGSVHQRARRAFLERVLFGAGRPMLLVPEAPVLERAWERFIVGWNASAEAMRAVSASLPLLMRAKEVVVATVDAKPSQAGHAEAPGHELAQHLARHGVKTDVRNLDGRGRSVEAALVDEAVALSADALVIGAYGHSRAREFLFGGVTRALLAHAQLPLLLSH
jgi:nucleotide-binding universal stress UspA family protein